MIEFGTATLLEILWSVLALVGLIITMSNVGEAMRDLMLGLTGRGGALVPVVAWNNVRNELVLGAILTVFLIWGGIAMLTPANPAVEADLGSVILAGMLVGVEILVVANSFANRRDRQVLKE